MGDGRMSRNLTTACWLTLVTVFVMSLAFGTPCWVVNDGLLSDPKFHRVGLWEVCFNGFQDPNFNYDKLFRGCYWIFDEELHFIGDILFQPFFIATQTLFTFAFTIGLFVSIAVLVFNFLCPPDWEILALRVIGGGLVCAGFFGTIAVIVFGALGDSRDWMPHWEHNYLSWSFAFGVVGVIFQIIAGTLFLVEAKRLAKRRATSAGGSGPSSAYPLK